MAENVKVAVRVRPFNEREIKVKASCIIKMYGKTTEIVDPANKQSEPKKFTFDQSYWSHDGYKEGPDGYLEAVGSKSPYVDQRKVFKDLGMSVLENAWKGYNCCMFAYGQTGSGKSYSVVGYGANKGIVPETCEKLFNGIDENLKTADKSREQEYQVFVSMLEIYNEQVRDLLNPSSFKVKGGLKVREHPQRGFYVESQSIFPVKSYDDINERINEGTRNRTIASTNMNATSSRAHTIVSIKFVQKGKNDAGQNMTKTSIINLVDLAGSERVDSTGATGDRLKEGAAINLSLSSLGNVIKALADQGSGKKSTRVPYRDSKLTMLLKNALGGNSKTIMIAALSPADINYDETLSTLRYADRAKSIKTKAVVNESPTEKLIRELKEENARLLLELQGKGGGGQAVMQGVPEEEVEELKRELELQMQRNQSEMDSMRQSWEQRLKEVQSAQEEKLAKEIRKRDEMKVTPHFWNLNEDPALTGMVVHFTYPGSTRVGNQKAETTPEIMLSGLSIQKDHATVTNKKGVCVLQPSPGAKVLLNGKDLIDKAELHHNDRVMFGSSHLYVFHHPQDLAKNQKAGKKEEKVTYDTAQEEIAANSGFDMKKGPDKSKDDLLLQEDLVQLMPMVIEANAMSEELKKGVRFEIVLISPQARGQKHSRTELAVLMRCNDNDNEFLWDKNKFLNRKYLMQEMYQNFVDGEPDWDREKDNDPFWEPPDSEVMIGCTHVYLQSLGYLIEVEELLGITDFRGNEQGLLKVEIYPCNADGSNLAEDDFVDEPEELLGRQVAFKIVLTHARGLPSRFQKSRCKYRFYLDKNPAQTSEIAGTCNPDYNYNKIVSVNAVTKQLLEYFNEGMLTVEVWGRQSDTSKKGRVARGRPKTASTNGTVEAEERNRMAVELNTEKKRVARLEAKLHKLRDLVIEAQSKGEEVIAIRDLQAAVMGGSSASFKAAARVVAISEKSKVDGQVTSTTCNVQ
ncbi:kinesin-like protein KIF28P [Acanthaster planci]|uniref:Kinesin-like protein 6 n=1 Tax=Acanthaster planci TaxID=133434 RepID=A0A8B7YVY9_ACAPL|nr:kinesin-like protein KIF28P [Acanthaster planci]